MFILRGTCIMGQPDICMGLDERWRRYDRKLFHQGRTGKQDLSFLNVSVLTAKIRQLSFLLMIEIRHHFLYELTAHFLGDLFPFSHFLASCWSGTGVFLKTDTADESDLKPGSCRIMRCDNPRPPAGYPAHFRRYGFQSVRHRSRSSCPDRNNPGRFRGCQRQPF